MKLYFSTLYLAITLLVVGGCAKKTEEPIPAPNTLPKPAVDIQQSQKLFLANGYDKKLTEVVLNADHTKSTQSLTPLWDKARQRDTPPAAACAYIPLAHTVTMINAQDYLLVAKTAKGLDFSVASYIYDPSKVNQLSPNDPSFFTTFTGTVLIKSLATGETARATYQNGTLTPAVTLPTKGTNPNILDQSICDYYTTCYFSGYQEFSTVTVGYVSSARGSSCLPPGFGAPAGFYSSISWYLVSSTSVYQCEYTPTTGGPNPLPPNNYPGGNGRSVSGPDAVLAIYASGLNPCAASIATTLTTLSGNPLLSNLQKLASVSSGYNWTIKNGDLSNTNQTAFTSSGFDTNTNSAVTTMDLQKYPNVTDLSIARTLLHESFHAYLVAYFQNDRALANQQYAYLVDAYQRQHQDINDLNHFELSFWVANLADGLQQYGQSKGYNLPNQFYQDMAWAGLEDTNAYKALSSADKRRIQDTIQTELTGKDSNGNNATQSGKNPGC